MAVWTFGVCYNITSAVSSICLTVIGEKAKQMHF